MNRRLSRIIVAALAYAVRPAVALHSTVIAILVGTVLSAVNQAEPLLRGPRTLGLLVKIFFNYLIPFIVSSLSAYVNRPRERSAP